MKLLVSGASATVARYAPQVGVLLTPNTGNGITWARRLGTWWACDNAAFGGFDPERYRAMLRRIMLKLWRDSSASRPLWVTAPDVVADAKATLELFAAWRQELRGVYDLPLALVLQDGLEAPELRAQIPWDDLAAVFIGGSTEWKLGAAARELAQEAKARGKLVHVGRVNTPGRMAEVAAWGCVDTIDGSSFSRFPDTLIPQALAWIEACA